MGSCLSVCIKKGQRFSTCFFKEPNQDDLKVKRRSMRLPADIGRNIFPIKSFSSKTLVLIPIVGVELGLGMTQKTINQYPQSQIIENFFSIDETELHYKNYAMKRIPIIQCRVSSKCAVCRRSCLIGSIDLKFLTPNYSLGWKWNNNWRVSW